MKYLNLLILFLVVSILGSSQSISKISVDVFPNDHSAENFAKMQLYPLIVEVKHQIELKSYDKDTLILKLDKGDYNMFFKDFFYNQLQASVIKEDKVISTNFSFDGMLLKIPLQEKHNVNIEISYLHQSDFGMKNNSNTTEYLIPFMDEWHSWYFTNNEIPIDSLKINLSGDFSFFCSLPYTKTNNTYNIELKQDSEISFYLIDNKYFHKKSFVSEDVKYNLYLFKDIVIDTVLNNNKDSVIAYPGDRITYDFESNVEKTIKHTMKHLASIFEPKYVNEINIIDASLSLFLDDDSTGYTWGRQFEMNEKQSVILVDTSYWNDNSIQHEIIHSFTKPFVNKTDSTYHLFSESLVEYLSLILKYNSENALDSVFNKKSINFKKMGYNIDSLPSIFDIGKNNLNLSGTGNFSNIVIYYYVPFLFHNLAKEVGYKKFILRFYYFCAVANQEETKNMQLLKNCLQSKDFISDKQWNAFIDKL